MPKENLFLFFGARHLLFIELPKFKPQTISEKKMQVLWLRFLTEINDKVEDAPAELLENAELNKALEIVEESAYSDAELEAYDKFWDSVRVEHAIINEAKARYERGKKEGIEQGRAEGILDVARNMKKKGIPVGLISETTGLTPEEIDAL